MKKILLFLSVAALLVLLFVVGFLTVPLPFALVERFAQSNYSYYFMSSADRKNAKAEWTDEMSPWKKIVMLSAEVKMREDWGSRLASDIEREAGSDKEVLNRGLNEIREIMISSLELYHRPIRQTTFASIVRGYGECDQMNAAVALLFDKLYGEAELFALHKEGRRGSPGIVAKVGSPMGTLYLDLCGPVPVFGFSDDLTAEGKKVVPTYEDVQEKLLGADYYRNGRTMTRYDFFSLIRKIVKRVTNIDLKSSLEDSLIPVAAYAVSSTDGSDASDALKKVYVTARIHHLFGRRNRSLALYVEISNSGCTEDFCQAARIFRKKIIDAGK